MTISTVITAYNQHEVTKIHVRECMNSTLVPDEIIVVNDHGDPSLKEMLKELEMKTKVIYAYINEDIPWNYTGARNLGVWLSKGDFIVSEDNDNIPSRKLYEDMLNYLQKHPDIGLVLGGRRPLIPLDDFLNKPYEEWKHKNTRVAHDDSFMIRREAYLKMKGYDERFAGQYAWACTDWTRRLNMAEIKSFRVNTPYITPLKGDTRVCECDKDKKERAQTPNCKDCGLAFKRRSYKNYEFARRIKHYQPPEGILRFTYQFELL